MLGKQKEFRKCASRKTENNHEHAVERTTNAAAEVEINDARARACVVDVYVKTIRLYFLYKLLIHKFTAPLLPALILLQFPSMYYYFSSSSSQKKRTLSAKYHERTVERRTWRIATVTTRPPLLLLHRYLRSYIRIRALYWKLYR